MPEKEPDSVKLAVLEEKVFNMVEVISKLDDTIEKLSDLSLNVSKMLAVHEEKLEFARESAAETARDIDELEDRLDRKLEQNSKRLLVVERRIWIGVGIVFAIVAVLQSSIVTGSFTDAPSSVIMREQS